LPVTNEKKKNVLFYEQKFATKTVPSNLNPSKMVSNVLALPNELWFMILANVGDVREKAKLRLVCRQLRACVDDSRTWKYSYLKIVAKPVR
jgi:hypothetical protein